MKKWYVIRVVSGQENKITKLIQAMAEDEVFPMEIGDIHIPVETVMMTRNGKKYLQKRRILPGYILIEIDIPSVGWKNAVSSLRAIDGVIGFASSVGDREQPQPLSEEEARSMLQFGKEGVSGTPVRTRQDFVKGESVNIINGPFIGFTGTVEEVEAQKSSLRVTVEIFGRVTPIDLTYEQVEKI